MTTLAVPPPGFPAATGPTRNRRLLDAVVSGAAPEPACVRRLDLPRPQVWSYGRVAGTVNPTVEHTWMPDVVFGGYLCCLVDQFAGLVMLTVLPDGATFLTSEVAMRLHSPTRPGPVTVDARVVRLTRRDATVEVTMTVPDGAGERVTSRATVQQVLGRRGGEPR
jgi:uncharacterized protein (TIGR00369 family)